MNCTNNSVPVNFSCVKRSSAAGRYLEASVSEAKRKRARTTAMKTTKQYRRTALDFAYNHAKHKIIIDVAFGKRPPQDLQPYIDTFSYRSFLILQQAFKKVPPAACEIVYKAITSVPQEGKLPIHNPFAMARLAKLLCERWQRTAASSAKCAQAALALAQL